MDLDRVLRGLDAQQRHAVTIDAAPLAIIASAGSGKTRVLTARIAHRIATATALPSHVLALTFTRDAAGELRRRLRRFEIREPVEAGTFHSIALRLLRDRALARNEPAPTVATDRMRLVREVVTELRLGVEPAAAMAELDWARARRLAPGQYVDAVRSERRRTQLAPDRFASLSERYGAVKRSRGVVDFDDLLERCLTAMEQEPMFADVVRWRFRHLFVDEAQDLNPLQHALLEAWRGGRDDLCLVGDPRQAIYGWNGADPRVLAEVEHEFPGITVVHLSGNYRCTSNVLEVGRAVLASVPMSDDSESRQGDGPAVEVRSYDTDADEAQAVADDSRRRLADGTGSVAVLARTNDLLAPIARALEARSVPVRRAGGRSPVDLVIAEAARCRNRDQLAVWADEQAVSDDPVRRRVAEEADRFLAAQERGAFRAWLDRHDTLNDLAGDHHLPGVELLTFHAAKGREWDSVTLVGIEAGLVPHGSAVSPPQRAEEARLLYVALTRASRHLAVTHTRQRNGRVASESPLLTAIRDAARPAEAVAPPAALMARRTPDRYADVRAWRTGVARIAGIADNAVCSDVVMRSLVDDPPADHEELAKRLGLSVEAVNRLRPLPRRVPAPDDRTPRAASR
jgi:DNA helicase-2/ATP-dependent DNA helicase PcrA